MLTSSHDRIFFFFLEKRVGFYYITVHIVHLKNTRDPPTADVMCCILFYKILKVKMSHQNTDIVANYPPGQPAWPWWTGKGKAAHSVQNEVLHTVEQCKDSSLRERASFHHWCLELFGQTTVFQMEIHPKQNGGPHMMQINWKKCKENKFQSLCSIVLRYRLLFPLMGRVLKVTLDPGQC